MAVPTRSQAPPAGCVYVVSNVPTPDGNSVLGYRRDADGVLTPLPGSPFPTGGSGYTTPIPREALPHFGPWDLDQHIVFDRAHQRLLACNGGSDTIAVFDVREDGSLDAVDGSPFSSGGRNPVSLGLCGERLYVVNKNEDPTRDMTRSLPNYTGFRVAPSGRLSPIPGARFELAAPTRSPTQALVVRDRFLMDGDFGSFPLPARTTCWGSRLRRDTPSVVRSLRIGEDGGLREVSVLDAPPEEFEKALDVDGSGSPDPLMFGLQAHPTEPLVYVCFVTAAKLGVYSYDEAGALTFVRAVPNRGELICWVAVSDDGSRAYTTNNVDGTISVYDLTDPTFPVEIETLKLRGQGAPYQEAIDSSGRFLHVVKHRTFPETEPGEGSELSTLRVHEDGTLTEVPSSPIRLPVPSDPFARPQGVAVT